MKNVFQLLCAFLLSVTASSHGQGVTNNATGAANGKVATIAAANAQIIRAFTGGWGKGAGAGMKVRQREFGFTAVVAKHNGDWDSSVEIADGKISSGDLPALLEFMSKESKGKFQTDYKNVRAVALDGDEIFAIKPVLIYFSGSKDFSLSDSEVANLQKYIRLGGAIWGNSQSGGRSAFDTAFRREMKRVMPDMDKDFERISGLDPAMSKDPYFADVKHCPETAVLRCFGEIAIIHTTADFSASAPASRFSSLSQTKSAGDLQYGVNLIVHLMTRWEEKLRASPRL